MRIPSLQQDCVLSCVLCVYKTKDTCPLYSLAAGEGGEEGMTAEETTIGELNTELKLL